MLSAPERSRRGGWASGLAVAGAVLAVVCCVAWATEAGLPSLLLPSRAQHGRPLPGPIRRMGVAQPRAEGHPVYSAPHDSGGMWAGVGAVMCGIGGGGGQGGYVGRGGGGDLWHWGGGGGQGGYVGRGGGGDTWHWGGGAARGGMWAGVGR